ncbi:amidohydrolase family protein [Psychromarinibacter sp. C21-152]|uniref:Amidohydrolase family protein n=1 Tax=Psychromarinibacter sediminicola TaxID=3033385 RepID=A0AAE3T980_9RHOB|nr:amidohydrolase family protein [Psychromarinibacter sediminicola]MDF0602270.1 amidohydrolase family protein [Psychromarinibacter sediminicola]
MTRIDAHQHFWNPARGDHDWMPMDNETLARRYTPMDMAPAREAAGVAQTVLVQAAATVHETEYMLGIADATPHVGAVVGWVDFERPEDRAQLERLAGHPKFRGVRPMIQDIPDVDWMLKPEVQWGYRALAELGLSFDALGFPRHLANFLEVLTRYPEMRTVVDHCMKPDIAGHSPESFRVWADGMARIAGETGAYCKLSGLVTEAAADWSVEALRPYADHVLEVFGPARVMWGSDWPVVRLRCEYGDWLAAAEALTEGLSADEKARVFGGTAAEFYRLEG